LYPLILERAGVSKLTLADATVEICIRPTAAAGAQMSFIMGCGAVRIQQPSMHKPLSARKQLRALRNLYRGKPLWHLRMRMRVLLLRSVFCSDKSPDQQLENYWHSPHTVTAGKDTSRRVAPSFKYGLKSVPTENR
jgi:hypothetical protein